MKKTGSHIAIWLMIVFAGCLEPYPPPTINSVIGYLVVDGFLNSTTGTVTVKLSRTNAISDPNPPPPDLSATVTLEQKGVANFPLTEMGQGIYSRSGLTVNPASQYRLQIRSKARNYTSDYVEVLSTPPIDSVYWTADEFHNGLTVYAATHDPSAKTGFYQWDYVETWRYSAYYYSAYYMQGGEVTIRPNDKLIYTCYSTENSSDILVASTDKQTANRVRFPLTFMGKGDPKISSIYGVYSILVSQRRISEAVYNYWVQLKKTTEDLGGLFDPLPNQVTGNIHGPANFPDPVLGYFSAGNIVQKRIYIDVIQLPEFLRVKHEGCGLRDLQGPGAPPLSDLPDGFPIVVPPPGAMTASQFECVDCTLMGGTTTKPAFWP